MLPADKQVEMSFKTAKLNVFNRYRSTFFIDAATLLSILLKTYINLLKLICKIDKN